MVALSLSERLAIVAENSNLSPISDSTVPATLKLYLMIYNKARCACYVDYMEGAQVLHDWLTSDGAVPLDTSDEYPKPYNVPSLCVSYDMVKLAEIVGVTNTAPDTCLAVRRIYAEVTRYDYFR